MTAAEKAVTITEFLEARIAEDEEAARAAAVDRWGQRADDEWEWVSNLLSADRDSTEQQDAHARTWWPARALAECAAKRAIITSYRSCIEADAHTNITTEFGVKLTVSGMVKGLELAAKSLAAVYADHADFRQEWAL